jgi:hypothetical protein
MPMAVILPCSKNIKRWAVLGLKVSAYKEVTREFLYLGGKGSDYILRRKIPIFAINLNLKNTVIWQSFVRNDYYFSAVSCINRHSEHGGSLFTKYLLMFASLISCHEQSQHNTCVNVLRWAQVFSVRAWSMCGDTSTFSLPLSMALLSLLLISKSTGRSSAITFLITATKPSSLH